MILIESFLEGLRQLWAYKLRSTLTMLGVIAGVAGVIASISLMQAAKRNVVEMIEQWGGARRIGVYARRWGREGGRWVRKRKIERLSVTDKDLIADAVEELESVTALVRGWDMKVRYKETSLEGVQLYGVEPEYAEMENENMKSGRFIEHKDVETWARVCVISERLLEELFPEEDPLGKEIRINEVRFAIVGVTKSKNPYSPWEPSMVYVPLTTATHRMIGREARTDLLAKAKSREEVEVAKEGIKQALLARHSGADETTFEIRGRAKWEERGLAEVKVQVLVLLSVAALCLLTGGIGIMNIMLVSVSERTREVGIRKSLGARRRDILFQFLVEALIIALIGGVIGIGLGSVMAKLLGEVINANIRTQGGSVLFKVRPELTAILVAFGTAFFTGVFFGVYPALKAARQNPVDALRYE